jgi:lipopolysaccharide/colanic/teichoic acid biosynthesis glycosyltransferase
MIRRCIDMAVSATALIVLAPLIICVGFLVLVNDGLPILFFQGRAGRGGIPFRIIKFRTMRLNAEQSGGSLTFKADPRITPLGSFLRQHKFDELPQLVNVLRGEMTLIGPRPEVLDWVQRYTVAQREVLTATPGLSDPVQLLFRHEQDFLTSASEYERLMAVKVDRQIEFIRRRTFVSDVATVLLTLRTMFPSKPSAEELAVYSAIRTPKQSEASVPAQADAI